MYMEYLRPHIIITPVIFYLKKDIHRMKMPAMEQTAFSKNALGDVMRSIPI